MFGNINMARAYEQRYNASLLAFTSLAEGLDTLRLLPPNNLGAISEYDFDVRYMNFIMMDNSNFIEFMKLIYKIYTNENVFLVVNDMDAWSNILVESLLKFIQQRYGINATYIKDIEDLDSINDVEINPYYGINNLDNDSERLSDLNARFRIATTNTVSLIE